MAEAQDFLDKIRAYCRQRLADKTFLMTLGAGFTMLLILAFWILNLRASFSSNPPGASLAKDLEFGDFKKEFNASLQKIENRLKAAEAKQQAEASASSSLDKNLDDLMTSLEKAKTGTSTAPSIATTSPDQNIRSLKANLLEIETRLQR